MAGSGVLSAHPSQGENYREVANSPFERRSRVLQLSLLSSVQSDVTPRYDAVLFTETTYLSL